MDDNYKLDQKEKQNSRVLVIDPCPSSQTNIRSALKQNGYKQIFRALDNYEGYQELNGKSTYTHVILSDEEHGSLKVKDLVQKIRAKFPKIVVIISSANPDVDEILELVSLGARGFLAKPFTAITIEETLERATKGENVSELLEEMANECETLAEEVYNQLDQVAGILKNTPARGDSSNGLRMFRNLMTPLVEAGTNRGDVRAERFMQALIEVAIRRASDQDS